MGPARPTTAPLTTGPIVPYVLLRSSRKAPRVRPAAHPTGPVASTCCSLSWGYPTEGIQNQPDHHDCTIWAGTTGVYCLAGGTSRPTPETASGAVGKRWPIVTRRRRLSSDRNAVGATPCGCPSATVQCAALSNHPGRHGGLPLQT